MLTNLRQEIVAQLPPARMSAPVAMPRVTTTNWRQALPALSNGVLTLRELRISDAEALLELLSTDEVSRFISPPPTSVDGFERFIAWAQRERAAGRYICFALVPEGTHTAIGIFQVRQLDPKFMTAEWGFAIGREYWGSGAFTAAARLTIDFSFETVGVHRLEARAAVANGRGNGALAKIGAVKEAILRRSFLRSGKHYDQALWSIVREDWRRAKAVWGAAIH